MPKRRLRPGVASATIRFSIKEGHPFGANRAFRWYMSVPVPVLPRRCRAAITKNARSATAGGKRSIARATIRSRSRIPLARSADGRSGSAATRIITVRLRTASRCGIAPFAAGGGENCFLRRLRRLRRPLPRRPGIVIADAPCPIRRAAPIVPSAKSRSKSAATKSICRTTGRWRSTIAAAGGAAVIASALRPRS